MNKLTTSTKILFLFIICSIFLLISNYVIATSDYDLFRVNMTSNTTPSPYVVNYSAQNGASNPGWYAFNGIINEGGAGGWQPSTNPTGWISIDVGPSNNSLKLTQFELCVYNSVNYRPKAFEIMVSNTSMTIGTIVGRNTSTLINPGNCSNITLSSIGQSGRYVILNISDSTGGGALLVNEIRLYFNTTVITSSANYNFTQILNKTYINTSDYLPLIIKTNVTTLYYTWNMSNNINSVAKIFYSINTSLNGGCAVFYGKDCQLSGTYLNKTMTLESNVSNSSLNYQLFNSTFYDNEYYPGYYPFNYRYIDSTTHSNYTAYLNNNIRFNVFNFSTNTSYFLNLEFNAMNASSSTASLLIYYCNQSYTNGNPILNSNCELIDSFLPTTFYSHLHNYSGHQGIPVRIQNVTKTQISYFLFVSPNVLSANGWNFGYVTNTTYNNRSFSIGNVNTWTENTTNTDKIFDIHLHPIATNDNFRFYTTYFDGNLTTNTSSITYMFYNQSYRPPSAVDILTPNCSTQYNLANTSSNIFVSWTNSTSDFGLSVNYTVYWEDESTLFGNDINDTNTLNYTWSYSDWSNYLTHGNYRFYVVSYDLYGQDIGYQTCYFNICENNWIKTVQPCNSNTKLIWYSDSNNCTEKFNLPLDNSTYEDCIAYVYNKQIYEPYMIPFVILGILMIIGIIIGITIYPLAFMFSGLCAGLIASIGIYYELDTAIWLPMFIITTIFFVLAIGMYKLKKD